MKIFIVEPYTRTPGHFERLAVRTSEALARLGNKVTLVTYGGIAPELSRDDHCFTVVDAAPPGVEDLDARYRNGRMDLTSFRAFFKREMQEYRTFRYASSLLRNDDFSVVHFYDADPILLTLAVRSMRRRRGRNGGPVIVLTIHEIARLGRSKGIKRRSFRWIFRHCLERLIKHDLDGIVVLDPSLKQGLLSHFRISERAADRIRVLPHGIGDPIQVSSKEEARRRLKLDPSETIFLVFGILRKDKRIDLAIEAIKGLSKCRLIIAGEAQDLTKEMIEDLVKRHGCERSVTAEIGFLPEKKMHDYFSACDVVVIPYDKSFKGLSGILTLACGHGRMVIASDVGQLGETVKRYGIGLTVEPDNGSDLHQAVRRFLSLPAAECAQIEERVRSYARLMDWDSACTEWAEFYRMLLNHRILPFQANGTC
ncbi:MAG TPA: glycosyltransferase family 4 protein [Terriglobia bacterium]|nr:glycosyltransferase family 4 protein [Terriglobia bacterium]